MTAASARPNVGRVMIVTGAGSEGGIGSAIVMAAGRAGARVVVADIDVGGAQRVAEAARAEGSVANAIELDLGTEASVAAAIEATVDMFGRLDVLVNNGAATSLAAEVDGRVDEMDVDVWDATMRVNLRGTMLGCKYAIPAMRVGGGGCIINVSAAGAMLGDLRYTAYGVSKAGLEALTRYVATQFGKAGIRCNAVSPGVIRTPRSAASFDESTSTMLLSHHLTPRLGLPDDIAEAVLYLASDAAGFVTGHVLAVNGGFTAHQPYYAQMAQIGT